MGMTGDEAPQKKRNSVTIRKVKWTTVFSRAYDPVTLNCQ